MDKTALLIIDMQVAMYTSEGMYPYKGDEVLENIRQILEKARAINMPIVFLQHSEDEEFEKGKPTWEICSQIAPLEHEIIVEKSSCDSFYQTNLHAVLQNLGVDRLITMGMQSEFCLDTTCRRAFSMDYKNVLIKDAHSTFDNKLLTGEQIVEHVNHLMGGRFAELKSTAEILEWMNLR